jgi:hypothetical protein
MEDKKQDEKNLDRHSRQSIYNMMRQLQEHVRSNIPAMVAQRSLTSFTLAEEELPVQAHEQVLVIVYPQDPFVGEPEVRRMSVKDIRGGLVNGRVQIDDIRDAVAVPDENGNYMYLPGTVEFDQVNAFYYTTFTLRMYERYAKRSIPWSFAASRIRIDPHVGNNANAFYDEQNQLLGFHTFTHGDHELSTAQSADIVSHEAAHAILDGIRDLYNESFGLGTRAFHESFSDISTVLVALHDDSLIRRLLKWTNGNLRMTTFVSEVAERLVELVQGGDDYLSEHTIYLRNAFNQFKAKPFDDLPLIASNPLELSRQEHSYSRLFSGAFYDILVGIYERMKGEGTADYIALYRARDLMGQLVMMAIEAGPVGEMTFEDMARTFLSMDDVLYEGRNKDVMKRVFADRGILSEIESDKHIDYVHNLPDLRLPSSINSWLASAQFLEDQVLPALGIVAPDELTPLSTHRNADGNVFMTYFSSRNIRLQGEQYGKFEGTRVDILGGLTLMFDSKDCLRNVCYRPVNDEDIRQIQILTAEMIQMGTIVDQLYVANHDLLRQAMPQGLYILDSLPGKLDNDAYKLIKYPVIFDEIPEESADFEDYLSEWGEKPDLD